MTNETVQEFVSWVRLNMPSFQDKTAAEAADDLGTAILRLDGRLGVEVSEPLGDEEREIIVTAFSDSSLFPLVHEIVKRLPDIPGWTFIPLKPPRGFAVTMAVGGYELNAEKLMFRAIPDINCGIQLLLPNALFKRLAPGQDREELAWLIVESGIGEELSSKLRHIEFASVERAANKHPITELASYLVERCKDT